MPSFYTSCTYFFLRFLLRTWHRTKWSRNWIATRGFFDFYLKRLWNCVPTCLEYNFFLERHIFRIIVLIYKCNSTNYKTNYKCNSLLLAWYFNRDSHNSEIMSCSRYCTSLRKSIFYLLSEYVLEKCSQLFLPERTTQSISMSIPFCYIRVFSEVERETSRGIHWCIYSSR